MSDTFADFLLSMGIPPGAAVFFIAMVPIFELRGAIPVGINILGLPWYEVLPLALAGNLLPVPFILLFLNWAVQLLERLPVFKRFFTWLFEHTRRRSGLIKRYGRIGLALFVAVPLPVTGAWTGSAAAVMLGLSLKQAFVPIAIGVLIAGVIVTTLSLMGWWGALIAGLALCALAAYSLWKTDVS
jgi:uncharacterized membrane protein